MQTEDATNHVNLPKIHETMSLQLSSESPLWKILRAFTDESREPTEAELIELRELFKNKTDDTYRFYRALEAEIQFHEQEIALNLAAKEKFQKIRDSLERRITNTMKYFQFERLPGVKHEIRFGRLNRQTIVPKEGPTEEDLKDPIKKEFVRVSQPKPKLEWDKTKIKAAIESETGCPIEGTTINEYRNLEFDALRRIKS